MSKLPTTFSGRAGEDAAASLLLRYGYRVLARNFHSKFGEIDIVAQEGATLVFVEVKTRWSRKFGFPEEAVTPWKLRSIIKTGDYFKLLHPNTPDLLRIDVVAIEVEEGRVVSARLIRNASG